MTSTYSEYMKARKEKDLAFFFGEVEHKTNKYFTFKHVQDEDNVVIITSNVRFVKGNPVLLVDDNKAVYLKDWAVKRVHNFYMDIEAYAVKMSRKYFKVYTFKSDFDDVAFDHEENFDELLQVAREQDEENMKIAISKNR